jgi:glutathione S-transferase
MLCVPIMLLAMPWGQVPVLDVKEGNSAVTMAQSATIARFLAKRFKLAGYTEMEHVKCEELVDASIDFTMGEPH